MKWYMYYNNQFLKCTSVIVFVVDHFLWSLTGIRYFKAFDTHKLQIPPCSRIECQILLQKLLLLLFSQSPQEIWGPLVWRSEISLGVKNYLSILPSKITE